MSDEQLKSVETSGGYEDASFYCPLSRRSRVRIPPGTLFDGARSSVVEQRPLVLSISILVSADFVLETLAFGTIKNNNSIGGYEGASF